MGAGRNKASNIGFLEPPSFAAMAIYPLSGASWTAKTQSSTVEVQSHAKRKEMLKLHAEFSGRGFPARQWELRKVASLPVFDADYWSDASLSLPHLATELPESVDTTVSSLLSLRIDAPSLIPLQAHTAQFRGAAFPPPLDSPALSESRYNHMQSVNKVCFTSVRSNGRLLFMQTSQGVEQAQRRLRSQRQNGRLLLKLYEESSHSEEHSEKEKSREGKEENSIEGELEEEEEEEDQATHRDSKKVVVVAAEMGKQEYPMAEKPTEEHTLAEKAKEVDLIAVKAKQETAIARKAQILEGGPTEDEAIKGNQDAGKGKKEDPLAKNAKKEGLLDRKAPQSSHRENATCALEAVVEEEEEAQGGGLKIDEDDEKARLYTKISRTSECEAFFDSNNEVLNLKRSGLASFLHNFLTRVRPLIMLTLWEY